MYKNMYIYLFIFMHTNHPLAMWLILMIQSICISLITGFMTSSFWFSYILFLISLGGTLVLFIYVISLASNEMFYYMYNILLSMMLFFTSIMIMYFL